MGQTIVEKILSHAGGRRAVAGEIVDARVSYVMTNDAVGELTIDAFNRIGLPPWDPQRTVIVLDHYIPATTENAARIHQRLREFSIQHGFHLFDQQGVCHQLMIERFVRPGDVVIGTDSHTCTYGGIGAFATGVGSTDGGAAMASGRIWLKIPETVQIKLTGRLQKNVSPKDVILKIIGELGADGATYKALQFCGEGAAAISNTGRLTMCNMAIEAGAKTAIFEPDETTRGWFKSNHNPGIYFAGDPDADYCRSMTIHLDQVVPQVSHPYAVDQVTSVEKAQGITINQAFIGSCTNGRLEDLRVAADILRGHQIAPHVRLLITPASRRIYRQALSEGLLTIFTDAGGVICNPGCSACFGGQGMLWDNEVCLGTHNRNFKGRMGHKDAKVYLASPATVAQSAISGVIRDPRR